MYSSSNINKTPGGARLAYTPDFPPSSSSASLERRYPRQQREPGTSYPLSQASLSPVSPPTSPMLSTRNWVSKLVGGANGSPPPSSGSSGGSGSSLIHHGGVPSNNGARSQASLSPRSPPPTGLHVDIDFGHERYEYRVQQVRDPYSGKVHQQMHLRRPSDVQDQLRKMSPPSPAKLGSTVRTVKPPISSASSSRYNIPTNPPPPPPQQQHPTSQRPVHRRPSYESSMGSAGWHAQSFSSSSSSGHSSHPSTSSSTTITRSYSPITPTSNSPDSMNMTPVIDSYYAGGGSSGSDNEVTQIRGRRGEEPLPPLPAHHVPPMSPSKTPKAGFLSTRSMNPEFMESLGRSVTRSNSLTRRSVVVPPLKNVKSLEAIAEPPSPGGGYYDALLSALEESPRDVGRERDEDDDPFSQKALRLREEARLKERELEWEKERRREARELDRAREKIREKEAERQKERERLEQDRERARERERERERHRQQEQELEERRKAAQAPASSTTRRQRPLSRQPSSSGSITSSSGGRRRSSVYRRAPTPPTSTRRLPKIQTTALRSPPASRRTSVAYSDVSSSFNPNASSARYNIKNKVVRTKAEDAAPSRRSSISSTISAIFSPLVTSSPRVSPKLDALRLEMNAQKNSTRRSPLSPSPNSDVALAPVIEISSKTSKNIKNNKVSGDVLRAIQAMCTVFEDEDEDDFPWLRRQDDEMDLEDTNDSVLGLERVKRAAAASKGRNKVYVKEDRENVDMYSPSVESRSRYAVASSRRR